jgi:hypothetical protein|tara:strand:- start:337 stop:831 length:495 start_codon:yes stop_codon:yes gene_type:complete
MSTLEVNTIDTVSGNANLTIGGSNNTGSTTIKTNNTNAVTIDNSQNLKFNSGYGSVATAYGVRAWVQFNGTGTVAIRASGNVSSITDNGTGDYTVNFSSALPDADYTSVASCCADSAPVQRVAIMNFAGVINQNVAPTASACRFSTTQVGATADVEFVHFLAIR